jgi:hypothetical protein
MGGRGAGSGELNAGALHVFESAISALPTVSALSAVRTFPAVSTVFRLRLHVRAVRTTTH